MIWNHDMAKFRAILKEPKKSEISCTSISWERCFQWMDGALPEVKSPTLLGSRVVGSNYLKGILESQPSHWSECWILAARTRNVFNLHFSLRGAAERSHSSGFAWFDLSLDFPNRLAADDLQVVMNLHNEPVFG